MTSNLQLTIPRVIRCDVQVSTARDMYQIGWQLEESINWKHVVERPNSRNARISGGERTGQRAHTERRRGRGPVCAAQGQASTTPSTTESSDEGGSGGMKGSDSGGEREYVDFDHMHFDSSPALQNQHTSSEDMCLPGRMMRTKETAVIKVWRNRQHQLGPKHLWLQAMTHRPKCQHLARSAPFAKTLLPRENASVAS